MAEIRFHPEAEAEYHEALRWYRARSARAAMRFELEAERVLDSIRNDASALPQYDAKSQDVAELLEQARHDDVVLRTSDGTEFLLVAIDEFDREIARTRNHPKLMALLNARAQQEAPLSLDEVKQRIGL